MVDVFFFVVSVVVVVGVGVVICLFHLVSGVFVTSFFN